jgi:hypothetical protein
MREFLPVMFCFRPGEHVETTAVPPHPGPTKYPFPRGVCGESSRSRAVPSVPDRHTWTRSYENSQDNAVAYAKQWNNPHPEVQIVSVDMVYADESWGVPALLAITAARAK